MTAFLTVDAQTATARSPMAAIALSAGARFERRGRWSVAVAFADPQTERDRLQRTVGFVDRSPIRKLELRGVPSSERGAAGGHPGAQPGHATLDGEGAWWCPVTPQRTLVLGGDAPAPAGAVDLTCAHACLELIGPGANELLARFCAIDVRSRAMPIGAFRPGSVARTPGYVLRSGTSSLLVLVGWALGEYLWRVVADAAAHLGGGPVGEDVLDA
jgi:glycine cleavage system aminomethyltransferase T